ncbi:hypothetical protein niasHS_014572 [Heterodera schachtii]|uniref:C2H2-type domain-containing protein n=1 Tax=Heterodera schachtii TaxID=97005 RepID=A0ABD2IML3_HETSC
MVVVHPPPHSQQMHDVLSHPRHLLGAIDEQCHRRRNGNANGNGGRNAIGTLIGGGPSSVGTPSSGAELGVADCAPSSSASTSSGDFSTVSHSPEQALSQQMITSLSCSALFSASSTNSCQNVSAQRDEDEFEGEEEMFEECYEEEEDDELVDVEGHDEETEMDQGRERRGIRRRPGGTGTTTPEGTVPRRDKVPVEKRHKCDVCGKAFPYLSILESHKRCHTGEKPFLCHFCDKRFAQKATLQVHERTHTGERPYKCKFCDKTFAQYGTKTVHEKSAHLGIRNYKCPHCDKDLSSPSALYTHKKTHGEKMFKCQHCPKTFTLKNYLKLHVKQVHEQNERKHSCRFCGKSFAYAGSLQVHLRTHTGERPYQCKFCPKAFASQGNLQSHERTHTGERPYACAKCGRAFIQKSQLTAHESTHANNRSANRNMANPKTQQQQKNDQFGQSPAQTLDRLSQVVQFESDQPSSDHSPPAGHPPDQNFSDHSSPADHQHTYDQSLSDHSLPADHSSGQPISDRSLSADHRYSCDRSVPLPTVSSPSGTVFSACSSSASSVSLPFAPLPSSQPVSAPPPLTMASVPSPSSAVQHHQPPASFVASSGMAPLPLPHRPFSQPPRSPRATAQMATESQQQNREEEQQQQRQERHNTVPNSVNQQQQQTIRKLSASATSTTASANDFVCKFCGKRYAYASSLYVHTRLHTGERPFRCNFCDKSFTNQGNMQVHLRVHTGEKPYKCDGCGKGYAQKVGLNIHQEQCQNWLSRRSSVSASAENGGGTEKGEDDGMANEGQQTVPTRRASLQVEYLMLLDNASTAGSSGDEADLNHRQLRQPPEAEEGTFAPSAPPVAQHLAPPGNFWHFLLNGSVPPRLPPSSSPSLSFLTPQSLPFELAAHLLNCSDFSSDAPPLPPNIGDLLGDQLVVTRGVHQQGQPMRENHPSPAVVQGDGTCTSAEGTGASSATMFLLQPAHSSAVHGIPPQPNHPPPAFPSPPSQQQQITAQLLEQLEQQQQLHAIRALLDAHTRHQQVPLQFAPAPPPPHAPSALLSATHSPFSHHPSPFCIGDAAHPQQQQAQAVPTSPVHQQQLIQQLLQLKLPPPPPSVVPPSPPPPLSLLRHLLQQQQMIGGTTNRSSNGLPEEAKLSEAIAAALSAHQTHVLMQ